MMAAQMEDSFPTIELETKCKETMEIEDDTAPLIGGPLDGHRAKRGRDDVDGNDYLMAYAKSKLIHAYRWAGAVWEYAGTRKKPRGDELFADP